MKDYPDVNFLKQLPGFKNITDDSKLSDAKFESVYNVFDSITYINSFWTDHYEYEDFKTYQSSTCALNCFIQSILRLNQKHVNYQCHKEIILKTLDSQMGIDHKNHNGASSHQTLNVSQLDSEFGRLSSEIVKIIKLTDNIYNSFYLIVKALFYKLVNVIIDTHNNQFDAPTQQTKELDYITLWLKTLDIMRIRTAGTIKNHEIQQEVNTYQNKSSNNASQIQKLVGKDDDQIKERKNQQLEKEQL